MEMIICVCIVTAALLFLGMRLFNLAADYDDADISIEHTGKKGNGTILRFKGKKKAKNG